MKKLAIHLLLVLGLSAYSQTKLSTPIEAFKREMSSFIDTVKTDFKIQDSIYLVFVANIHNNQSKSDFSFTLGYILNSGDLSYVNPNYCFFLKGQIIVIRIDPTLNKKFIKELTVKKINKAEKLKILKKLF